MSADPQQLRARGFYDAVDFFARGEEERKSTGILILKIKRTLLIPEANALLSYSRPKDFISSPEHSNEVQH